ncbi:GNAT family N-acetyltransferase [Desulfococcaceae bacterium OttesenSCG-928-F15]|nr:GNAT family N-acetyltransferase [Desulfococcaceae bacterium OttesenSCG-928-F15]
MIRKLLPSDQKLYLELAHEFYHSSAVLHAIPDEHLLKGFHAVTRENPYTQGFLIETGGIPAGYAIIAQTYSVESGGMILWIEELFLLSRFRGKGLGEEFIAFIEQEYAGKVCRFRLEVLRSNAGAIRLYERLGYRELDYFQMIKDMPQTP